MAKPLQELGPFRGYDAGEEMPIGSYAVLVGGYLGLLGVTLRSLERAGALRRPVRPADLVLLGAATFHLSRLVTKDWVTAPVRAPFVRYETSKTAGEVSESSRGSGMRRAIGDLLSCNYCIGPWLSLGLLGAYSRWPGPTRFTAGVFALSGMSSFLNRAFSLFGTAYELGSKRTSSEALAIEAQEQQLHA